MRPVVRASQRHPRIICHYPGPSMHREDSQTQTGGAGSAHPHQVNCNGFGAVCYRNPANVVIGKGVDG